MDKQVACIAAEFVCEAFIGGALGIGVNKLVVPHCNKAEKAVVTVGTSILGWAIGREFAKKFYKFCDAKFDTEFNEDGLLDEVL